jgi:hypothetical protein
MPDHRESGRKGGRSTSSNKLRAARLNGQRGGLPRGSRTKQKPKPTTPPEPT